MQPGHHSCQIQLSVLMRQECDGKHTFWVAQCLEHDIAAQGESIPEAQEAFAKEFMSQLCVYWEIDQDPLQMIKPAPKEYWDLYKKGKALLDPIPLRKPSNIPPAWMIPSITANHIHVI